MLRRAILLKPREIAERAGVLTSKITYYASLGLLRAAEHSEGGQKYYNEEETLIQLDKIKKLIAKGYSLEQVREKIAFIRSLRRILIIDDEQEVVDLIVDILKDQFNFDINYAKDGFSAGKMLNTIFPDLVVLDLNLPGINGFELCAMIRADRLHSGMKILAITGYDNLETRKKILECGANAYLAKPFGVDEFKQSVFDLLNIRKKRRVKSADRGEEA